MTSAKAQEYREKLALWKELTARVEMLHDELYALWWEMGREGRAEFDHKMNSSSESGKKL